MTLNISPEPSNPKASDRARPLVTEVVDELTSWNPREFITAFQRWHQGQVSLAHLNVLILLEANGPMPMGRVADALDISVASATGIVDRMESRGLVERHRNADDRRVVLVVPAAGAKAVLSDIDTRRRKALTKLLAMLTDDELSGLLTGHRALRAARVEFARTMGPAR
ncbi:MAG TPA: MarR family transcriptional regulator [Candidatus Dormibacteraeota bacterium]|nr:MarR family transcriptional regulator [Candidatus Dormibacteraeota bacterium]